PTRRPSDLAMPPMGACDEEDGSPCHQVYMFHPMAPTRAPATIARPFMPSGGLMMPEPTVWATPVPRKAPSRLKNAAMSRATRGGSALVDTEVAMAFAASWKPFV